MRGSIMPFSEFLTHYSREKVNRKSLLRALDFFLMASFSLDMWDDHAYTNHRVFWKDLGRAKRYPAFNNPGLYIWGCGKEKSKRYIPKLIYIGKAKGQSLSSRLQSRYIGTERSTQPQCRIAEQLSEKQVKSPTFEYIIQTFFPNRWEKGNYRGLKPRCEAAMKFYKEGVENIWFIIIPIEQQDTIDSLEDCVISVGNEWNLINHSEKLLNRNVDTARCLGKM